MIPQIPDDVNKLLTNSLYIRACLFIFRFIPTVIFSSFFHTHFYKITNSKCFLPFLTTSKFKAKALIKPMFFKTFAKSETLKRIYRCVNFIYHCSQKTCQHLSVKNTKIVIIAQIVNDFFYILDIRFLINIFRIFQTTKAQNSHIFTFYW